MSLAARFTTLATRAAVRFARFVLRFVAFATRRAVRLARFVPLLVASAARFAVFRALFAPLRAASRARADVRLSFRVPFLALRFAGLVAFRTMVAVRFTRPRRPLRLAAIRFLRGAK